MHTVLLFLDVIPIMLHNIPTGIINSAFFSATGISFFQWTWVDVNNLIM